MDAVSERADLQRLFEVAGGRGLKTTVLEVHEEELGASSPVRALQTLFPDQRVEPTEDGSLQRILGDEEFVVDSLDLRFWRFHTFDESGSAQEVLSRAVNSSRYVDRMWLPREHLLNLRSEADGDPRATFKAGHARLPGKRVNVTFTSMGPKERRILQEISKIGYAVVCDQVALRIYDPDYGRFEEKLSRDGVFIAAGETFKGHDSFVSDVVGRYSRFVAGVESNALRWERGPVGVRPLGKPIFIRWESPFPDWDALLEEMFSCRHPFRLWGVPRRREKTVSAEAVDLHVGQRLTMEIGDDWMRVYVREGGCGNTVARLIANLQESADAPLRLEDPELRDALEEKLVYAGEGELAFA